MSLEKRIEKLEGRIRPDKPKGVRFVELFDENWTPLPPEEAERKLREAEELWGEDFIVAPMVVEGHDDTQAG